MIKKLRFDPFPFLGNAHLQTILSSLLSWNLEPRSEEKQILLPDGDRLSLQITTPTRWTSQDPTVVLLHGLSGSHRSPYLVRMTKRLESFGIRAVRVNMRGCGSGKRLAKEFYHSGRSEDVLEVLKVLKAEHPESPIDLIGYSMGANIALKLAGELSDSATCWLQKVIAVSPPADLYLCIQYLKNPYNWIYEQHFFQRLKSDILELYPHRAHRLPKRKRLFDFDDSLTAPYCNFSNALDYYAKCSGAQYVPHIRLPCKILFAEDDPFIPHMTLDQLKLPKNVEVLKTEKGGHLGYLGTPFHKNGVRWLDSLLIELLIAK